MKLSDLKVNPSNPRTIKDARFKKLCNSIRDFPKMMAIRPIVIDRENGNLILGGNMRYLALKALKFTEVPDEWVRDATELTEDEKRRFIIEDNMPFGEWDFDALANSFDTSDLIEWGFDEKELGVTQEPIDAEPQIDRAEELNKKWQVKTGDLWQIGEHRLLCGDSTKNEDFEKVIQSKEIETTLTDPPYNIGKNYGSTTDDLRSDYMDWNLKWFNLCKSKCIVFTPGTVNLSSWCAWKKPKWICIWYKKNQQSPSGLQGFNIWEPILVYGQQPRPVGHDGFDFPVINNDEKIAHPVPKSIDPWMKFCETFSSKKEILYDPFLGSGTTMVACQNLNRKCRGIEISPNYCSVILQRMQDAFPDLKIERIEHGRT